MFIFFNIFVKQCILKCALWAPPPPSPRSQVSHYYKKTLLFPFGFVTNYNVQEKCFDEPI